MRSWSEFQIYANPLSLTAKIHVKKKKLLFAQKKLPDDKTRLILHLSIKLKVHDIQKMRDNRKAFTHTILAGLVSIQVGDCTSLKMIDTPLQQLH